LFGFLSYLIDDLWFETHDFSQELDLWFVYNDMRFVASALNWICLLKLNQNLKFTFLRNHHQEPSAGGTTPSDIENIELT
jgi:hypothetical protein